MVTESLTTSMNTAVTAAPTSTAASSETVPSNLSGNPPPYQLSKRTLATATNSAKTSPCLPPNVDSSPELVTEVISDLLDDNLTTCMKPFQLFSLLRLAINTEDTWGSLLRIQVTGEGLDCLQPSTQVYMNLTWYPVTDINKVSKQECPFVEVSHNENLITCNYECRPAVPCVGPASFGVQVQRLSWLARSKHLERLCDVRSFIWI